MINTEQKTKQILNKYNLIANKRFGQNFLISDNILSEINNISNISKNDLIIEIGPGLGNLTEYLINEDAYLLLIEIDNKMIEILNDRFSKYTNFTLLNEDVLKINLDSEIHKLEEKLNRKFDNVKVVANLPYYITTPIIFKLLQDENRINEIIVMIQKEVAQRMVATPKSKDYGILTLMAKYYSNANIELLVPNTSFIPAPNVESAVISLKKAKNYTVGDENLLFELIHKSFAQRRKKMINSLENSNFSAIDKSHLEKLFKGLGISFNARAEELELDTYIQIVDKIKEA